MAQRRRAEHAHESSAVQRNHAGRFCFFHHRYEPKYYGDASVKNGKIGQRHGNIGRCASNLGISTDSAMYLADSAIFRTSLECNPCWYADPVFVRLQESRIVTMQPEFQTVIADTPSGRLRGSTSDGLTIFKGIPYAQPPVGEWRFHGPRDVEPWDGIRDALQFGPVPHQLRISTGLLIPDSAIELNAPEDENCLLLNVYAPATAGRRPVLMYIHGGNFVEGAGSQAWTEPSALARRGDLVVVTINYRLGALGWLFLDDLGGRELGADSNLGLQDQIAALRWISRNIGALGGDPGNVTMFGYSAGAWSISALLAAGRHPGYFKRPLS